MPSNRGPRTSPQTASSSAPTPLNLVMPQEVVTRAPMTMETKYSGGMELMAFWKSYQDICALNGWSQQTSRRMFPLQLKRAARLFYDELRLQLENEGRTMEEIPLEEVVEQMRKKFITESARDQAKLQLKHCKQKKGERLLDFEARFKMAAKKAGHEDGQALAYRYFRNINVRNVPLKQFRTVGEVTNFAKEYEDGEIARGKRKTIKPTQPEEESSSSESEDEPSSSSDDDRPKKRAKKIEVKQVSSAIVDPEISPLREILVEVKQMLATHAATSQTIPQQQPQQLTRCQFCGKAGHIAPQCYHLPANQIPVIPNFNRGRGRGFGSHQGESRARRGQQERPPTQCYNCRQLGHIARECPLLRQQNGSRDQASGTMTTHPLAPGQNGQGN